jgi:hypothetical protein
MTTSHQRIGLIYTDQRVVYVENHFDFMAHIGMYLRFIPQMRLYRWNVKWGAVPTDVFERWWAYSYVDGNFVEGPPLDNEGIASVRSFADYLKERRAAYDKAVNGLAMNDGTHLMSKMVGDRTRAICEKVLAGAALTKTERALFAHFKGQHVNLSSDAELATMLLAEESLHDARRDGILLTFLEGCEP